MAEVLKLGFAGLSMDATKVLHQIADLPYLKLAAAADSRRKDALERFRRDFGANIYDDIVALCKDKNVDAVYISTAPEFHAEHAQVALRHRKHVIVEKPMALTLEDAEAMNHTAEKNGVKLLCGHTHSFDAPIRRIREIIRQGSLGPVRMINSWNFNDFTFRRFTNRDLEATHGVLLNQAPHQVDIARLIAGGKVRSVRAMAGNWEPARTSPGAYLCFLEFENGAAATLVYSGYAFFDTAELFGWVGEGGQPRNPETNLTARRNLNNFAGPDRETALEELKEKEMRYGAQGLKAAPTHHGWEAATSSADMKSHQPFFGLILVSCEKGDIRQSPDGLFLYGDDGKKEISVPLSMRGRQAEISELYDAIFHDRPLFHSGRWGEATLEACLAIVESSRNQKEVYLSHQVAVQDGGVPPV
jgi:predicted dehydrogenase